MPPDGRTIIPPPPHTHTHTHTHTHSFGSCYASVGKVAYTDEQIKRVIWKLARL